MDDDEALHQAMALSLVTAKEDDMRRRQRYGDPARSAPVPMGFDLVGGGPPPGSNTQIGPPQPPYLGSAAPGEPARSTTPQFGISRPRPQPRNTGRSSPGVQLSGPPKVAKAPAIPARPCLGQPPVPPRPGQRAAMLDTPVHAPPVTPSDDVFDVRLAPVSQTLPRQRKTSSGSGGGGGPPGYGTLGKPPALPPSGDPGTIRLQRPPSPSKRRTSPLPSRATSVSPLHVDPSESISQDTPLIALSPNYNVLDFDLSELDPLNAKLAQRRFANNTTAPSKSTIAATESTNPFGGAGSTAGKTSGSRPPPPIGWNITSAESPTFGAAPDISGMNMVRNPAYGTIELSPRYKQPPAVMEEIFRPLPTAASGKVSPSYDPHRSSEAPSSNYTIPDGAMYGLPWSNAFNQSEIASGRAAASFGQSEMALGQSAASGGAGDLMDFQKSSFGEPTYLSLESFDPLFAVESADDRCDSTGLFTNPLDRFKRNNTPNPFPDVHALSTHSLLRRASVEAAAGRADARDVPAASSGELQDPFSVNDLTNALEVKRQQHAKEQERRHLAMKQSEEEEQRQKLEAEAEEERLPDVPPYGVTLREKKTERRFSRRFSRSCSYMAKGEESSYEMLQEFPENADEEIRAFCEMVARIKLTYRNTDEDTNPGLVVSPRCRHPPYKNMTVKLIVKAAFIPDPGYPFTCDVNSTVSHVIGAVMLTVTDSMGVGSIDQYILKTHGLSEFLLNESIMSDYEYVQECLKLDKDIKFVLMEKSKAPRPFKRGPEDDRNALFVPKAREVDDHGMKITRDKLNILMETFYNEVEKLRDQAIQHGLEKAQTTSVLQAVKAVIAVVYRLETIDLIKAVQRLQGVNPDKGTKILNREPLVTNDSDRAYYIDPADTTRRVTDLDDLHIALEELTTAVKCMIELYCRTFHTDFRFLSTTKVIRDQKDITSLQESLIVNIATAHRIPIKVKSSFEDFKVICGLYYGGKKLTPEMVTRVRPTWTQGFQETIVWDEWIQFESVVVAGLPRETRLCFTLVGVKTVQSGSDQRQKVNTPLGWVAMQVFNHNFELVQGSQLLGLWHDQVANALGTTLSNTENPNSILLQVNMPEFDCDIVFPAVPELASCEKRDFTTLHPSDQEVVQMILEKDSITSLVREEGEFLWEKRHYLYSKPEALPRVTQTVDSWWWGVLHEVYSMVAEWEGLQPEQALELLLPHYPDNFLRTKAAEWLRQLSSDEFINYMPQLVQALKFESYHTGPLAQLLLEKAIGSVRVAHELYWSLKEAADDVGYRKRYQLMFGALLSVVGESMRREFTKQEDLTKMLTAIAEKVKAAKEKEAVLYRELHNMWDFLQHDSVRLPLNPAMEVSGLDVKSCSYFTSFTFPLKLVMRNVDHTADSVYAMFKVGDDLRQDMLTMQLINIMNRLWLQEGLDLRMVTFKCTPTGFKKGLVEIVTESETLRKIQVKYGIAGSFKDRPIAEWLQMQNPTELEYEKAVANFTASCAGYCVATYVLGICDRHNDNIMIKQSGHMFHIDFAKFLGDSQMFGNFKRDRVPFVLTSDMAYVINGGDRPSSKFQHFVDLCCQAFLVIRQHGNLFLNLFSMLSPSGITGVTSDAAKYVHHTLMPDSTDIEATAVFTRMINDSLKSSFTQINFFIHNLAQMKFSGHAEGALLSFIPKTYSIHTDGRISHVEIHGFQKRYSPEKFYIYIMRVQRENQTMPSFVFRRYSEFVELQQKLVMHYPLVRLPSLHSKVIMGRTHVRSVAEARKGHLQTFLRGLLSLAAEISESDLIYTFFHPMLRDEQDMAKTDIQKLKVSKVCPSVIREEPSPPRDADRSIQGQVKLSIFYKSDTLTVVIMHVKDLGSGVGGEAPDPYVKLYLLPDPHKVTKRKTKIAKGTFHPTYNEVLIYHLPLADIKQRTLQVTVWNYNDLKENEFLGGAFIKLAQMDLTSDRGGAWFPLQTMYSVSTGGGGMAV